MNILLTSADRHVAMLEAFRSAMSDLAIEGRILAADAAAHAAAFRVADAHVCTPSPREAGYICALQDVVEAHDIGLVVPLGDADVPVLSRAHHAFASVGCEVAVSSCEAIALCYDAEAFRQAMQSGGLAGGRRVDLDTFRRDPFYPCFVRPFRAACAVTTPDAAAFAASPAATATGVAQDFSGGREYRVDVYMTRADAFAAAVPRQQLTAMEADVGDAVTVQDEDLVDLARAACRQVPGLRGPASCHIVRPAEGEARVLGIVPRLTYGMVLSMAAGAEMPRYLLQEACGQTPDVCESFTANLLGSTYRGEVFQDVPAGEAWPDGGIAIFR